MKRNTLVSVILGMLTLGTGVGALAQEEILEEELLFMEIPVVVTASKTEQKLTDAPGVITVVTKDELERFGGTTLKDILERIPSLIGSTVYMTDRSIIAARGAQFKHSGSHILLLINGRPVREVLEGGIITETLESFPINIIEKIEVIRGPGSVLYGSGAFSAVINVITEKAEKNGIAITGLAGEAGAYGALGEAKCRLGDLSIVAAGRYHKKPDWKTTLDYLDSYTPGYLDPTGNVVSPEVNIPNKGPGAYLGINYKNLSFMSTYNEWKNAHFITEFSNLFRAYGNDDVWKKGFADLGYGLEVNENWNMDINLTYTRATLKIPSWPNTSRDSYEVIAECANFINPLEKLRIALGGLYDYINGEEKVAGLGTISDDSRSSFALYTQVDYWLREDTVLIGGFQANKVENIDLDIVPRVGLILYPVSNINVKALYSQAFRAPSINEIGIDFPDMKGNPDLKSERVDTIDIGVNCNTEKVQCGVNYFFSKQTEVIFQDRSFTEFPDPTYDNIGEIEHQGVEFEGKYYISRSLFLTGSALYQTNKDKEGNENVTPTANSGAKVGISYKSKKGVTLSLFDIYQGDLDKKFDTQVNPSPGAYSKINLHCRLDMNKFFGLNLGQDSSLLLQIDNLLDEEIWLPNWGLLPGSSIPVNQGRTIYLGAQVSF